MGHAPRREELCKVAWEFEVEGNRKRGRPRIPWMECVRKNRELRD